MIIDSFNDYVRVRGVLSVLIESYFRVWFDPNDKKDKPHVGATPPQYHMVPHVLVTFLTFLRRLIYNFKWSSRISLLPLQGNNWRFSMRRYRVLFLIKGSWDIPCCDGRLTFRDAGSFAAVITVVRIPVVDEPSAAIEQGILWVSVSPNLTACAVRLQLPKKHAVLSQRFWTFLPKNTLFYFNDF